MEALAVLIRKPQLTIAVRHVLDREFAREQLVPVASKAHEAAVKAIAQQPVAEDEIAVVGDMSVLRPLELAG